MNDPAECAEDVVVHLDTEERIQLSLLSRQRADKAHRLDSTRMSQRLDAQASATLESYWKQVDRLIDDFDQLSGARDFMDDLVRDIEMLKGLRVHVMMHRMAEAREEELARIENLLRALRIVLEHVQRRVRELADDALMAFLLFNPAAPNTTPKALRDHQKDKQDKRGRRTREVDMPAQQKAAPKRPAPQMEREMAKPDLAKRDER
jgi:hypothetical protein